MGARVLSGISSEFPESARRAKAMAHAHTHVGRLTAAVGSISKQITGLSIRLTMSDPTFCPARNLFHEGRAAGLLPSRMGIGNESDQVS